MMTIFRTVLALILSVITLGIANRCLGAANFLISAASSGGASMATQPVWVWLSIGEIVFSTIGLVGVWVGVLVKKTVVICAFLSLLLIFPVIIEASQCDVSSLFCRAFWWASIEHFVPIVR
ncbi:MAG: hypothetical protein KBA31_02400 [Alphaproteobacteria bacterium]|nr:hypothetical protein [Alphaproteobacteria bacterium]